MNLTKTTKTKGIILTNEVASSIKDIQSTTIMIRISTKGTIAISTSHRGRERTSIRTRQAINTFTTTGISATSTQARSPVVDLVFKMLS